MDMHMHMYMCMHMCMCVCICVYCGIYISQVACEDYEVVMQLEAALEDWTPAIASALETQLAKQPVGKGPLAEIEFWRARNAALSTLCEQLNTPNARRMLEVLERVESQLLSGFYGFYGELARDLTAPPRRAATP